MKRTTKRVLFACLSLVMLLCACFAVACGESKVDEGHQIKDPPNDGIDKINYSVTVLYPDAKPVKGIEVYLYTVDDEEAYSGATTGDNGVAKISAGKGIAYYVVLKNIPDGYVYESDDVLSATETSKTVYIESSNATNSYDLSVMTVGGMPLEGVSVSLKNDNGVVGVKSTDGTGVAKIRVPALGVYDVELSNLPKGYSVYTQNPKTSATAKEMTVEVISAPIKEEMPKNHRYAMDDIIYDFTVTVSDGTTFTLSEALEENDLVFINFWYTTCGPCRGEFDDIQYAYERFQDNMSIIALSTSSSDTDAKIVNFKSEFQPTLTFDMGRDSISLYSAFSYYAQNAVPTSIFVDRYGKICNYIRGSGTEALFKQEFGRYTAEDYVQTVYDPDYYEVPDETPDKPDVSMPASEEIVKAINKGGLQGTYIAPEGDTYWPWILTDEGLSVGNTRKNNTTAMVSYQFTVGAGQYLTFDYLTNTEDIGNADILSVMIDGIWVTDLERVTNGEWLTCYIYTPLDASVDPDDADRQHTLTLVYAKDSSESYLTGDEKVVINNMRVVGKDEIPADTDVNLLRQAAWNPDAEGNLQNYATVVFNVEDGYYHVGTEDGPYLLANITGVTQYSQASVSQMSSGGIFHNVGHTGGVTFITLGTDNPGEGSYVEGDKGYAWYATNSKVQYHVPVDYRLKIVLDELTKKLYEKKYAKSYSSNTWLELCAYVDNLSGTPIENPIKGLCDKEAITMVGGDVANHVVVDRTLVPRGIVYKYVCKETGAYSIYSIICDDMKGQAGAFVYITGANLTKSDDAIDNFNLFVTLYEGETYYVSVAFDQPGIWGEMDVYVKYVAESYDDFIVAGIGAYTWKLDEDGNFYYDDNGDFVFVTMKNNDICAALGDDGYYHQILPSGELDGGDTSYMWISVTQNNSLWDYSLLELARGYYEVNGNKYPISFEELGSGVKLFDFSGCEDMDVAYRKDWTATIEEYANKVETEGNTAGMVKADAQLVKLLELALARLDHDTDDAWMNFAWYYDHVGLYTPQK